MLSVCSKIISDMLLLICKVSLREIDTANFSCFAYHIALRAIYGHQNFLLQIQDLTSTATLHPNYGHLMEIKFSSMP